jgi:hypothetical protein
MFLANNKSQHTTQGQKETCFVENYFVGSDAVSETLAASIFRVEVKSNNCLQNVVTDFKRS